MDDRSTTITELKKIVEDFVTETNLSHLQNLRQFFLIL